MLGYGASPPSANWPAGAKLAVQFVINYEEGGENCILHGDEGSEAFLSEIIGAQTWPGQRHWNMESIYEYGARAGFWRLHRLFTGKEIPITVFGVATALQRSPAQVRAMQDADWEIASHGLKWIDYKDFSAREERKHIREAIKIHEAVTGERPRGWYTGRCSANTVDLITEEGGFEYSADTYADDLPYWHQYQKHNLLMVPYTLDCNDMRFATPQGYNSGDQFLTYLKDTFDTLYSEGLAGSPKIMSIGLHCRLAGRPGRIAALARFLEYMQKWNDIWFARRIDIARHWSTLHPPVELRDLPSQMDRKKFIKTFGGVFENSPWIAERAFKSELGHANNTPSGLHAALAFQFRNVSNKKKLEVLRAHPDLAGKLAAARRLTPESEQEQAGAGLDALTDSEKARFTELNASYTKKFGFPFIIAVKGLDKKQILKAFERRIDNNKVEEFKTACSQVERIALLRLEAILAGGSVRK